MFYFYSGPPRYEKMPGNFGRFCLHFYSKQIHYRAIHHAVPPSTVYGIDVKATITHWRFLLENRRDTANLRTADERHKVWRFCFHFHGITAVVRQDTLSCAHLRQQYDQDWSSGSSVAASVRKPHALSRLHDAHTRCAAFVGAHTRCTHVHWCSSALLHHHSRSLAEARRFLALTHDKMKWRRAQ